MKLDFIRMTIFPLVFFILLQVPMTMIVLTWKNSIQTQFPNNTRNMAPNEGLLSVLVFACLFLPSPTS